MPKLENVADLASLSPVRWLSLGRQDRVRMVESITKAIKFMQNNIKTDHEALNLAKHIDIPHMAWPPARPLTRYDKNKVWVEILPCDGITAAFMHRFEAPMSRVAILNPTDGRDPDAWLRGAKNVEASFFMRSTLFSTLRRTLYEDALSSHNGLIHSPQVKLFSITPASEVQLWQEKHIYVDFISCHPLHPESFSLKTNVTDGVPKQVYTDATASSVMFAKIIGILKTAALEGIQTLVLVPFGTEPKFGHPVEVIAKLFEIALLGTRERPPVDWRSFGIQRVIIAIDGVETNGWCQPDDKVRDAFYRRFTDLPGVHIDADAQQVRQGIAAFVRA